MSLRRLVAAAALGVSALAPALLQAPAAQASGCGLAAARAAVREAAPRLRTIGPDAVLVTPAEIDRVLCGDTTGDGRADLAVTIASGGSAGDVGYLLFRRVDGGWRLERKGAGYKLGLFRRGSSLELVQPVYRAQDPYCCPTGGFDRTLLGWRGGRYAILRTSHTAGP